MLAAAGTIVLEGLEVAVVVARVVVELAAVVVSLVVVVVVVVAVVVVVLGGPMGLTLPLVLAA